MMLSLTGESAQVIVAGIAAVSAIASAWLVVWAKKSNTTEHGGTMDTLTRVEAKVDTMSGALAEHIGWHKGHGDTP
jgi:hypothetical protein